ncbi:MAG: Tol-Pal system beta propeller repeat protein TolB [Burkholderiales bacterium]
MRIHRTILCALSALGLSWALLIGPVQAQMTIEVTGAGAKQYPIAITGFPGEASLPESLTAVLRSDLERSGLFRIVDTAGVAPVPTETSQVRFPDWRTRNAEFLAIGVVAPTADGRLTVRARLVDVVKGVEIGAFAYAMVPTLTRTTAHRLADDIYEKITGEKGFFNTKIAYVKKSGQRFDLIVADADGQNEQSALTSREPVISPRWSPDGNRLAYVSFENRKPQIWVHEIYTSRRTLVANFRGSNSAPAWSPDGRELAVVLTLSGQSQLYLISSAGGEARRLATSNAIDTEPIYAPDGASIFFTSDRGGGPQIYRIAASGGEARRVTFKGAYNASPRLSPDGRTLAYITRNNGLFQVATLDLTNGQELTLTDTVKDESPSFSPNGRMILYATEVGGRGVLAAVSTDGRVKQRLSVSAADAREPAWGPFARSP